MANINISWNDKSVTFSCVPNCFLFVLWAMLVGRSLQNYEKYSFFSAFSGLGPFPQALWEVKECLVLQLHEVIRVLHVILCPIVFIFFYDWYWQGGVLKLLKNNHFFSIFSHFGNFPQAIGKINEWPILEAHKIIRVLHAITCPIVFILFYDQD